MSGEIPLSLESVAHILNATFQGEQPKEAEAALQQLELRAGYHSILLQLTTVSAASAPIRQSAAVRLKNICESHWSISEGEANRISDADRQVVKANLLQAIIFQQEPHIQNQLLTTLYYIARRDYPDQWPELSLELGTNLSSSELFRVHGAMQALTRIFKKYELKTGGEREAFCALLEKILPVLVHIFEVHAHADSLVSYDILRCICKCFFKANQMDVPMPIRKIELIGPWINALLFVMEKQIKPELLPKVDGSSAIQTRAALSSHPLWRAKKWCTKSLNRIFLTHGQPALVNDSNTKIFAKNFFVAFSEKILACFMNVLKQRHEGKFVPDRIIRAAYIFLNSAHKHSSLFRHMKPHLNFLLLGCVLPTLCLSNEELETWRDDPQEYIRLSTDPMEFFTDHHICAQNFLIDILKVRTRYTLQPVMAALNDIFETYAKADPKARNYVLKEGAMRMLGCMRDVLLLKEHYKWTTAIVQAHVFPEFSSPSGYMRARACWTIGRFAKVDWKQPQIWSGVVQSLTACMLEPELPVSVQAAQAISRVIRNEAAAEFLTEPLPKLLDRYFQLLDELGSEIVVVTLKRLIQRFEDDIAPFTVNMLARLVTTFTSLVSVNDYNENDEAYLTAVQCLETIHTIIWAAQSMPHLYPQMEQHLEPLLRLLIHNESMDFFEGTIEILSCLSYFPKEISPMTWSFLPEIFKAFTNWAADFFAIIASCLDNYLMKGIDVIVTTQNPPLMQYYMAFIQRLLTFESENKSQESAVACNGAYLMASVFLYGKGKIDALYPDLLSMLFGRLNKVGGKQLNLKLMLFMTFGTAFYANPPLFLEIILKMNQNDAEQFFNMWLSHYTKFDRARKYLKVGILAFSSFFTVPLSQMPPFLRSGLPDVLDIVMKLLQKYERKEMEEMEEDDEDEKVDDALRPGANENGDDNAEDEDAEEEDAAEEDENGDIIDVEAPGDIDGSDEGAYDSDGDDVVLTDLPEDKDAIDDSAFEATRTSAEIDKILGALKENKDDDDEGGDVDEVDPESSESPLDEIDPFIHFSQVMQMLAAKESAFWQHLNSREWKKKDKKNFQNIMDEAVQRQLKMAKEKKEREERLLLQQQKTAQNMQRWANGNQSASSSSSSSSH